MHGVSSDEGSIKRAEAAAANASGEQIMAQVDTWNHTPS